MAINLDFTTFTEYDAEFSGTILSDSIAVSAFSSRDTKYYNYDTDTYENFAVDFTIDFSTLDANSFIMPFAFTNAVGDIQDFLSAEYFGFSVRNTGTLILTTLGYTEGAGVSSGDYTYTISTPIYGRIVKDGFLLYINWYSDSGRTTLLTKQELPSTVSDIYTNLIIMSGNDSGVAGSVTGSVYDVANTVYDQYDMTVTLTGPGTWSAVTEGEGTTYGPFASGTQALDEGVYTITFSDETGYFQPIERPLSLTENTTITTKYIEIDPISDIAQNALGAWVCGNSLVDVSGNGLSLVESGTIASVVDFESTADSASSFTAVAGSRLVATGSSLTVNDSFWIYVKAKQSVTSTTIVVASQYDTTDSTKKLFDITITSSNTMRFRVLEDGLTDIVCTAITPVVAGTWYSILGQYNNITDELTIYVDGVLENTVAITGLYGTQTGDTITIGNFTGGLDVLGNGVVSDVVFDAGIISQPDITTLANLNSNLSLTSGDLTVAITGPITKVWNAYDGVNTFGPFASGTQTLTVGTYTISFDDADGYYNTPTDITGVVVTDGGSENEVGVYTAYTIANRYIASNGTGTGESCSDPIAFGDLNQTTMAPDSTIHGCPGDVLNEMLLMERGSINIVDVVIEGKVEVVGSWSVHSGNVYKIAVGTPNVDYIQSTEPGSPTIGERWYKTTRTAGQHIGLVAWKWDGSNWIDDPDWFLKPELMWLDGVKVNMSKYPSSGWAYADTSYGYTSIAHTGLVKATDYWKNGTVSYKKKVWLVEDRFITLSSSSGVINFDSTTNTGTIDQNLFYIENVVGEIASEGQWAYDWESGELYMWFDDDPANHTVEYSGVNHGIYALSNDDLNIAGVEVRHTNDIGIQNWYGDNPSATDNWVHHANIRGDYGYCAGAIDFLAVNPLTYSGAAVVVDGDYSGIERLTDVVMNGNKVHDIYNGHGIRAGLYIGGTIQGDSVFNIGASEKDTVHLKGRPSGIYTVGCDGVDETLNIGAVIAYNGIEHYSQNGLVQYNVLGKTGFEFQDVGGIYSFGGASYGNDIGYNILNWIVGSDYDTLAYPINGLYTDEYAYDNIIHDNIVYNVDGPTLLNSRGLNNNNHQNTPANAFNDNDVYSDSTTLERNPHGPEYATFSGNTLYAASAYQTWDLTITTDGGWWSEDGGTTQRVSDTPITLSQGAYVITYEDDIEDDIEDEVIALLEDTVLDRSNSTESNDGLQVGNVGIGINSGLNVGNSGLRIN